MIETKTVQIGGEELSRCQERSWLSREDEKRFGIDLFNTNGDTGKRGANPVRDASSLQYKGILHIGQRVFLPGDHYIGLITKLFIDWQGNISHLAIRTGTFFGQHKLMPIRDVSSVTPVRAQLSIDRKQFHELPEVQSDPSIQEAVDRALWENGVLRQTDYPHIDVQVRDGIILLNGYVSSANQWRVNDSIKNIPGSLGMKSHLVVDDKLLLQVVSALLPIERVAGSHVFARVQHGVVELSGEVINPHERNLAEQYAGNVPWVRSVINTIRVPGMALPPVDPRFLQPLIGQTMYFQDGLSGIVQQVIIHRDNRRVIAIVLRVRFPEAPYTAEKGIDTITPERLAVIPMNLVRYMSGNSGFLLIDSTETTRYKDFDPKNVVSPSADWVPPYPYCNDHVLFWLNKDSE